MKIFSECVILLDDFCFIKKNQDFYIFLMPWNICVKIQPSEHDPYSEFWITNIAFILTVIVNFKKKVTQIFPGPTAWDKMKCWL